MYWVMEQLLVREVRYRHRANDLLKHSSKTNYERMTRQLTIWLTIIYSLTVTIDGSKRTNDITSLHGQYHHGLTDRRPITSRLNWQIRSITKVLYYQLTRYNSLWLWRWLPRRLSKRQWLTTIGTLSKVDEKPWGRRPEVKIPLSALLRMLHSSSTWSSERENAIFAFQAERCENVSINLCIFILFRKTIYVWLLKWKLDIP